jgi:fucose permease
MISIIVVFTLGIAQAFYGITGILQFITLYLGSFFLQQDGWLKKAENPALDAHSIHRKCKPEKRPWENKSLN